MSEMATKPTVVFEKIDWENTAVEGAHFPVENGLDIEGIVAVARKAIQHVPEATKRDYRETIKNLRKVLKEFLKIKEHDKVKEWFVPDMAIFIIYKSEICLQLPYHPNFEKAAVIPALVLTPFFKAYQPEKVTIVVKDGFVEIYGGGYE